MNVKCSLSIIRALALMGAALIPQLLQAQEVYDWEAWRAGRNPAGLVASSAPRHITQGHFTDAQALLYGSYTSGSFHSLSQADELWGVGASASAQSYYPNLLLLGHFSFDQETGNNMMGSMFTTPGYYPLDVLEFTPGKKTRQTYGVGGGFAWRNRSRFIPAATVRFQGVNYAKRKDLRHTTYRQEVEAVPSLLYDGGSFRVGASYLFLKTSEYIKAEQIGSATAESYYVFLDKGLRYGVQQEWSGSGVHLSEPGVDRFPVKEVSHGASLQAEVGNWLYADAEYSRTLGEAGEKGHTWFRFPGHKVAASLQGTLHGAGAVQVFRLEYQWMAQRTHETVIEKVSSGGVVVPAEHGSNCVFQRRYTSVTPSWRIYYPDGLEVGVWGSLLQEEMLCSIIYPYKYAESSTLYYVGADLKAGLGPLEMEAGLELAGKVGSHERETLIEDPSMVPDTLPVQLYAWRLAEDELYDVTRMQVRVCLRYPFTLAGKYHLFAQAACTFTEAFGVQLLPGDHRQQTILTLGYNF